MIIIASGLLGADCRTILRRNLTRPIIQQFKDARAHNIQLKSRLEALRCTDM